jgi:pyruvate dehydrogenase E2 component (dihydrolipoamide acetyltransferase)
MATIVILPKQGLQMTEGLIIRWLVGEGQKVEAGQALFEMETDKVNMEIESPASGTLLKILRGEGETVPVAETIGVIGAPGEDLSGLLGGPVGAPVPLAAAKPTAGTSPLAPVASPTPAPIAAGRRFSTPRARTTAAEKGLDVRFVTPTGPEGLVIERDVLAQVAVGTTRATPLARKIAADEGVDLSVVPGTGNRGKVQKSDVEAAITAKRQPCADEIVDKVVPLTGMRRAISDRMMQSLHNTAQANHRIKVDMSEIVRFREKLKQGGASVSYNDILTLVVARGLQAFPILNASLVPEGVLYHGHINIGFAVAVENGLLVPVIKGVEGLSLDGISKRSAELADRAKKGGMKPEDLQEGTFTITNLGMYDIDEFTAIVNYPESAILAVGKIDRVPVVEGDAVVIRPVAVLSLTYDHRIIDGAPAAQFLQLVKRLLQNPYLLA